MGILVSSSKGLSTARGRFFCRWRFSTISPMLPNDHYVPTHKKSSFAMRGSAAHKRLGLPMCFEETGYCGARENDNLNIVVLWLGVRANVPTPTLFFVRCPSNGPMQDGAGAASSTPTAVNTVHVAGVRPAKVCAHCHSTTHSRRSSGQCPYNIRNGGSSGEQAAAGGAHGAGDLACEGNA